MRIAFHPACTDDEAAIKPSSRSGLTSAARSGLCCRSPKSLGSIGRKSRPAELGAALSAVLRLASVVGVLGPSGSMLFHSTNPQRAALFANGFASSPIPIPVPVRTAPPPPKESTRFGTTTGRRRSSDCAGVPECICDACWPRRQMQQCWFRRHANGATAPLTTLASCPIRPVVIKFALD